MVGHGHGVLSYEGVLLCKHSSGYLLVSFVGVVAVLSQTVHRIYVQEMSCRLIGIYESLGSSGGELVRVGLQWAARSFVGRGACHTSSGVSWVRHSSSEKAWKSVRRSSR